MSDLAKTALTIFGAIITLAIIAVVISRKGNAPAAISALTGGLARVVGAAVSPLSAQTNGNNGAAAFSTPAIPALPTLSEMLNADMG